MVPLTETGRSLAAELGEIIKGRLKTLHTSPVLRCVETAEAIRTGADASHSMSIEHSRLLGKPGVYVLDSGQGHWEKYDHHHMMQYLMAHPGEPMSGMARPDFAARFLVLRMLAIAGNCPGLHVFVTHDSLVSATVARLFGQPLDQSEWPHYLEGAFFWMDGQTVSGAYRDMQTDQIQTPLCGLNETDVVELARHEIAPIVGLDSDVRFFLAGGAFKTLLTGRPPRDLDLWAPSAQDREKLVQILEKRGAIHLGRAEFSERYQIRGRVVDVPNKVEPPSLEERLGRFDLALSAVGVEYGPAQSWRPLIHPLAQESVQSRKVLLLKPLANPSRAKTSLERGRRYAKELGYIFPPEEEQVLMQEISNQAP